ncbi:uncharacterized protein LOC144567058 [Carex rostrata]
MKAPGSTFAKIRLCTQKSQVGPTTKIKRQLVQRNSSQRKRSCISICSAQRQGTSPAAAVTAERSQVEDDEFLHAAALSMDADNRTEAMIEKVIYGCRFMTFLGITGSLMGSVICFLKGCIYVFNSFGEQFVGGGAGKVITMLVEAIDCYLIGTVMLVFGMGLYELFICNLDIAKTSSYGSNLLGLFRLPERPKWLQIKSVNELKTKVGHVIVMVLLIGLFENSKKVVITTATDLLYFSASILLSSGCLFLLSKLTSTRSKEETDHAPEAS